MTPSPVVGIGASAGGVDALLEFMAAVNPASQLSYVIVQHLDPSHPSALTELLASKTVLSVVEAANRQAIAPRTVYVIPPNCVMMLDDGHLIVSNRIASQPNPTPIDRLFESLADEEGPNCIGVILSGTGNDGAAGLRAIKNAGGLTFAQDKASSRFFSMPQAAIEMDAADQILSPRDIAQAIDRLIQHPYFERTRAPSLAEVPDLLLDPDHENLIRKILVELKVRVGIDFALYKKGTIRRRLARRLAVNGISGLKGYLEFLKKSRDEAETLSRELLIQVTDFFRDPDVFEGLTHHVFPHILKDPEAQRPIRIWVPGCATGEEIYSIAITLLEYLGPGKTLPFIQLFGTDLSESAIEHARAGIYPETISRHVSEERLLRFFDRKNETYRVNSIIRDLCIFARQNVVDDPPFSRLDLISCRNLLIYLDPALQKKVMKLFHYALRPGGFLLLGPSETVGATSELFTPVDKRLRIFAKKFVPGRNHTDFSDQLTRFSKTSSSRKLIHYVEQSESDRLIREADRIAMRRYLPPGILCDAELNILEYRGDTSTFIGNPNGPPCNNLRRLLKAGLLVALENAIRTSRESAGPTRLEGVRIEDQGVFGIEIIPVGSGPEKQGWLWIFFIPESPKSIPQGSGVEPGFMSRLEDLARNIFNTRTSGDAKDHEIIRLTQDLQSTRTYVRDILEIHEGTLEELKAAEEELLSSNEEFQTTNEELETAQEELQSSNDELRARNRELNFLNSELTQAKEFAEAIVEAVFEPLLVLNEDLTILKANRAFYRVFSVQAHEVEGVNLLERWKGTWVAPEFSDLLHRVIPDNVSIDNQLIEVEMDYAGLREFRVNAQSLHWSQEDKILLILEDITELQLAVNQLRQMDRRKDEFMAMLAHELRNPLTPIRNALEIWRKSPTNPEDIQKAQETMDRQLTHEARLIDELIDLSRINSGAISLKRAPVDFVRIVSEVLDDLRPQADTNQLSLIENVSVMPVIVNADQVRLAQVVTNLVTNAIKFTPAGGTITVALLREGGSALLNVTDTGIGIEPDLTASIFDLFMQADKSLERTQGGLGIGLTLVRRLVELHQGEIHAYSEGKGKGSSFTVRIPVSEEPLEERVTDQVASSAVGICPGKRILIVDDNVDSAESLALLLEMEGHTTQTAHDGLEGIKAAGVFAPDVVLLDIGLPGVDGYEVARTLRATGSLSQPLLIAISGYGQASDIEKSLAAGFDYHLVKPADINQIKSLVQAGSKHS